MEYKWFITKMFCQSEIKEDPHHRSKFKRDPCVKMLLKSSFRPLNHLKANLSLALWSFFYMLIRNES